MLRIFQIGFNKCGTRTLHQFFLNNGFSGVHWDAGKLGCAMYANLTEGKSLVHGYDRFEVFSDMEHIEHGFAFEAYKLFPHLAKEFPDAIFILNTRDREAWIKSRFNHGKGRYARKWKKVLGLEDDESLAAAWRVDWDHHHARARDFFAGTSHRFFEFDIAEDSPEVIARAIPERRIDVAKYHATGRTRAPLPAAKAPEPLGSL